MLSMKKTCLALLALASMGCATLYGQTDDFGAKLARGCGSVASCKDLRAEADARVASCEPNTIGRIRCADARADAVRASRMLEAAEDSQRQRDAEQKAAEERAAREQQAELDAEYARIEEQKQQRRREELEARKAEETRLACADLDARIERQKAEWVRRSEEVEAENERRRNALAWAKKNCRLSREAVTARREGVDRNGYIRVQQQVVGLTDVAVCPLNTPPEIAKALELEQDRGRLVTDWPIDVEILDVHPFIPPTDSRCRR